MKERGDSACPAAPALNDDVREPLRDLAHRESAAAGVKPP